MQGLVLRGVPGWKVHWVPEDQVVLGVQEGQSLLQAPEVPTKNKKVDLNTDNWAIFARKHVLFLRVSWFLFSNKPLWIV